VLAFNHYQQSSAYEDMQFVLNIIFTCVYTIEALLKLIAYSYQYFKSWWNVLDFVIVCISWLEIIFDAVGQGFGFSPGVFRALRVFRVVRALRLIGWFSGIRKLFLTLVLSIPAMINIGAILCLMVFIFAIVGMNFFGNVMYNGNISQVANFETFADAFLLLFRLTTIITWDGVLTALCIQEPFCDPNFDGLPNGNCGSPTTAYIYMFLYVFLMGYILINLYIAVILDNYAEAISEETSIFSEEDFKLYYDHWAKFDPSGSIVDHSNQIFSFYDSYSVYTTKTAARLHLHVPWSARHQYLG
jgi:voltage-gated sodium channel type IV alpha